MGHNRTYTIAGASRVVNRTFSATALVDRLLLLLVNAGRPLHLSFELSDTIFLPLERPAATEEDDAWNTAVCIFPDARENKTRRLSRERGKVDVPEDAAPSLHEASTTDDVVVALLCGEFVDRPECQVPSIFTKQRQRPRFAKTTSV